MRRIALTIFLMVFVTGSGRLIAEPGKSADCCAPKPADGIQGLHANTIYPKLAMDYKLEGDVVVLFHVDRSGKVSRIKVVKSAGPAFDESALRAIANTAWEPAKQNGKPVAVDYAQEFKYRIP